LLKRRLVRVIQRKMSGPETADRLVNEGSRLQEKTSWPTEGMEANATAQRHKSCRSSQSRILRGGGRDQDSLLVEEGFSAKEKVQGAIGGFGDLGKDNGEHRGGQQNGKGKKES